MTELLVQWRTKINWNNHLDWIQSGGGVITFTENDDKLMVMNIAGQTTFKKEGLLKVGKKYKVKVYINNFVSSSSDDYIRFFCGTWSVPVVESDGISVVVSTEEATSTDFIISSNINTNLTITKLEIEEVGYTPLSVVDNIALNYSIADVKEYEKRKGTYSKAFTIPGTPEVNKFFNFIFNINEDSAYNINAKCKAALSEDSSIFVEGFIGITEIVKLDDKIVYEVGFYGDQLNIFTDFDEQYLHNLDCSDLTHTVNYQHIIQQQVNFPNSPANSGYTYPWIDYGGKYNNVGGCVGSSVDKAPSVGLTTHDFFPAISVKYLVDKIFSTFGYTYSSSIFESEMFSKLIIPFVNEISLFTQQYLVSEVKYGPSWNITMEARPNTGQYPGNFGGYDPAQNNYHINGKYKSGNNFTTCDGIPSYSRLLWTPVPGYDQDIYLNEVLDSNGLSKELYRRFNYGPYMVSNITPLTNDLTGQASEVNTNNYQTHSSHIPGTYLVRKAGKYRIKARYIMSSIDSQVTVKTYLCKISKNKIIAGGNDSIINSNFFYVPGSNLSNHNNEEVIYKNSHTQDSLGGWTTIEHTFDCEVDDMIYFKFCPFVSAIGIPAKYKTFQGRLDTLWFYEYGYGENCVVNGNHLAPKDVRIKDFMTDLISMFNLYIDVDKTDATKLIIEPRNNFYQLGETRDWSNKLSLSNDIMMITPKDYQAKHNIFAYKNDKDYSHKLYEDKLDVKDIGYGNVSLYLNSDFATGTKTNTHKIFASTPLRNSGHYGINGKDKHAISRLVLNNYPDKELEWEFKTNWKPRILFANLQDLNDNSDFSTGWRYCRNATHTGMFYKYPYAGHILNPFDLTSSDNYDLDYDTALASNGGLWQKTFSGWPEGAMTNRNLWNLYYKNQFNQMVDDNARLMTAYFDLNVDDIKELSMSDNIFVNGTYFTINKIFDFNPSSNNLTKVELLKIVEGLEIDFEDYSESDVFRTPPSDAALAIMKGRDNLVSNTRYGLVIGEGNNIYNSDYSLVVGNNNTLIEDNSVVLASNNTLIESQATVINSENITIQSGLTNVSVLGDRNITINESDVAYINGIKIKDGILTQQKSIIDGGNIEVDGVFNAFKFYNYHINDAGENGGDDFDINIWEIEDGGEF